jgi:hypothetical protein
MLGIHSLLCDSCNLCFRGFAIPGTVPTHAKRKSRDYRKSNNAIEESTDPQVNWSHDSGLRLSEVPSFARYYLMLRINVLRGKHQTTHSLGLKYRMRQWQHWNRGRSR